MASQDPYAQLIGQLIGPYRVTREIGRGGMGAVFVAEHGHIGQRIAIKVLSPTLEENPRRVDSFFGEARAVSKVNHPGLVKIFDCQRLPSGRVVLLMELLEGETLWQRQQRQEVPLQRVLVLGRQIASALAAVHARGIIHRDIKPDNIMIVTDREAEGGERIKLLDFGIAKIRDEEQSGRRTTGDAVPGTPAYMSTEQCRGDILDDRTDVYSLGVVLYELLCGALPFTGPTPALLTAHILKEPPPLRRLQQHLPKGLAELVHQMLSKVPATRPPWPRSSRGWSH